MKYVMITMQVSSQLGTDDMTVNISIADVTKPLGSADRTVDVFSIDVPGFATRLTKTAALQYLVFILVHINGYVLDRYQLALHEDIEMLDNALFEM